MCVHMSGYRCSQLTHVTLCLCHRLNFQQIFLLFYVHIAPFQIYMGISKQRYKDKASFLNSNTG